MDSKKKVSEDDSVQKGNQKLNETKEKLKDNRKFIGHIRDFFSKEKKEFDGLTQVRQASFIVAALLVLSLLSGAVGNLIISLVALAFLFLGIQGKVFAKKIMPKLPIIFLGALVLVLCFWVITFVLWIIE